MREHTTENDEMEGGEATASLPCLNSNNSTETPQNLDGLTSYQRKAIRTAEDNIARFIDVHGAEHCLFTTLTFPDHVTDMKEAQKRFNSLSTHFLRDFSPDYISVKERCKSGRIHYHLLLSVPEDVQTGFDHSVVFSPDHMSRKVRYFSVPPALKGHWAKFRAILPAYGFGRSELAPIRTNSAGLAKYLTKYLSKGFSDRHPEYPDKGVRLVNYSSRWLRNSSKFSWNSARAKEWRRKVALFARLVCCSDLSDLSDKLGPQWAYQYLDFILEIDRVEGTRFLKLLDELSDPSAAGDTPPETDEGERAHRRRPPQGKAYGRVAGHMCEWEAVFHQNAAGEWIQGFRPPFVAPSRFDYTEERLRERV